MRQLHLVAAVLAATITLLATAPAEAVYQVTDRVTDGPAPQGLVHHSVNVLAPDGRCTVFTTDRPLRLADQDAQLDVYVHDTTGTRLVSTGNGPFFAGFAAATPDCSTILWSTSEAVLPADIDANLDVYASDAQGTRLITPGSADLDATFKGMSTNGNHVWFETAESLENTDLDAQIDVYDRTATGVHTVTTGSSPRPIRFMQGSASGESLVLVTSQRLVAADADNEEDFYVRTAGGLRLLCGGAPGTSLRQASPNLDAILCVTGTAIAPEDIDQDPDLYVDRGGVTTLVDPDGALPVAVSPNGDRLMFTSHKTSDPSDPDAEVDIYGSEAGVTTLLTPGTTADFGARVASEDARSVVIATKERLAAADDNSRLSLYVFAGGSPRLLATGADGTTGPAGEELVSRATPDLSRIVLLSDDPLTPDAPEAGLDNYVVGSDGSIQRLPRNTAGDIARIDRVSDDGLAITILTDQPLLADDANGKPDLYLLRETGPAQAPPPPPPTASGTGDPAPADTVDTAGTAPATDDSTGTASAGQPQVSSAAATLRGPRHLTLSALRRGGLVVALRSTVDGTANVSARQGRVALTRRVVTLRARRAVRLVLRPRHRTLRRLTRGVILVTARITDGTHSSRTLQMRVRLLR